MSNNPSNTVAPTPDSSSIDNTIEIAIPKSGPTEDPPKVICSYNKCEGCKTLFPIAGMALVQCPGCQQPTLLMKLTNCPKCNEPVKEIRLRVDHVTEKMPLTPACQGQAPHGDTFIIDLVKEPFSEKDPRNKNTYKFKQITVAEKAEEHQPEVEKEHKRPDKSNDCGCKKTKVS